MAFDDTYRRDSAVQSFKANLSAYRFDLQDLEAHSASRESVHLCLIRRAAV
jgi:hypothetical protein